MDIIPYQFLFLLIVCVALIIILISSIYYTDEDDTVNIKKSKSLKNLNISNLQIIRPEIVNNCYILNINELNKNIGYSISGIFTNSCISIYKNNERITNYKANGERNIVLACNENVLSSLYKINKYKTITIPLQEGENYKVVIDYIKNVKVQQYTVNIDINYTPLEIKYPKISAYNEYDIDLETRKTYNNIERQHFDNYKSPSEWFFYKNGARYLFVTVKNSGNYNIIDNNESEETYEYRDGREVAELEYKEIDNPNIKMVNLDYVAVKKDINTEYIDLVTSPNYLLQKFLYGDKYKDINYNMYISNKCIVYKIL